MAKKKKSKAITAEKLTPQMEAFCVFYCESFNATQAAKKAGYGETGAHVQGSRLLRNPKVQEYIRAHMDSLKVDAEIRKQRTLRQLDVIAFTKVDDLLVLDENYVDEREVKDEEGNVVDVERDLRHKRFQLKAIDDIRELTGAIASITDVSAGLGVMSRTVRMHDPIRAMELAAKLDGTIKPTTQKVDHTNSDGTLKPVHRTIFMIPPNGRVKGK